MLLMSMSSDVRVGAFASVCSMNGGFYVIHYNACPYISTEKREKETEESLASSWRLQTSKSPESDAMSDV